MSITKAKAILAYGMYAPASEVVKALKKRGISVTPQYVYRSRSAARKRDRATARK